MRISEIVDNIEANKENLEFLPTGFEKLDNFLDGGFMRKELIVLGGSTGSGKSYAAAQMLFNIAKNGFKCGYFSLEISNEMIVSRLIGGLCNIKPTRIITAILEPVEEELKLKAKASLTAYEDNMAFYDDIYLFDNLLKEIKEQKFDFVVIDFIQNILFLNSSDEYSRLSRITIELQKLAKEVNSCIFVLSQLSNNKAKEGSGGAIEYRGSGTIAIACDLGLFIERGIKEEDKDNIAFTVKKNRRGISHVKMDNFQFIVPGGWIKEL